MVLEFRKESMEIEEKEAKASFSSIFEVYFEGRISHINGRLESEEN